MVATGDDRTPFYIQTAVLTTLSVVYLAIWAVAFWRTECRHHHSDHQRRARKTPSRYTYQQNAAGSAIHSGQSPTTTYDAAGRASTTAGSGTDGAGGNGGGGKHGAAGTGGRTFPYWVRRLGVALTCMCLLFGLDLTSSLGWLPVELVVLLPDISAALILGVLSCWLFYHSKPLYQQLRGTSGRPGEFPVHLRRTLFVLPVAYGVTNMTCDVLAPALDRKLFTALGQLSIGAALVFYLVVYPYVAWTLTYELDRFSKSVTALPPTTTAATAGTAAGPSAPSDPLLFASPRNTTTAVSPSAAALLIPIGTDSAAGPLTATATGSSAVLSRRALSARTGDGADEATTTPNTPAAAPATTLLPLPGSSGGSGLAASPAMGQSELKLPAAASAPPALELSTLSSPIAAGRTTAGAAAATGLPPRAPSTQAPTALTLTVSPLHPHRSLPVGGWASGATTTMTSPNSGSPAPSPGRSVRSVVLSPAGAGTAAASAKTLTPGAAPSSSVAAAASAGAGAAAGTRGGAMQIDTSYLAAAIRTIVIFGTAVEVIGAGAGAFNVVLGVGTLTRADVLDVPFARPPDTLDPFNSLSMYAIWFPILPFMMWVSWGVK